MIDVTQILSRIDNGDAAATDELLPIVYEELRVLARRKLAHEAAGQTLQATALVHEAYLRLLGGIQTAVWQNKAHFFAAAAEAMRRILVDQARRKQSKKRAGDAQRIELEDHIAVAPLSNTSPEDLIALDEALREFEAVDPLRARVVKLHCFGGLSLVETADVMGVSSATVKRYWMFARAWLYGKLKS